MAGLHCALFHMHSKATILKDELAIAAIPFTAACGRGDVVFVFRWDRPVVLRVYKCNFVKVETLNHISIHTCLSQVFDTICGII